MAKLIPEHITKPERTPQSEWEVISALKDDVVSSKTWTVIHSLEIRRHITKLEGEADLLVLAPGLGVMVVEVKGCNVSRKGGVWTYHYSHPKSSTEGPFEQARSAMHSLRKWLENKSRDGVWLSESGLQNWKKWAWHSCVVFTSLESFSELPSSRIDGPEWEPSEVIARSDIRRSNGIAEALARAMKARRAELAKMKREGIAGAAWYDDERSRPTGADIDALVRALRPDFHYEGEALANIQRLECAIRDATDAQATIASSILENQRLVLKGAAGTGKTFVAVRLARYLAESGLRVGFLCFNTLLGAWLRSELTNVVGDKGFVGTYSRLMLRITGETVPSDAGQDFWECLTERAQERLLAQGCPSSFDVLIVDEAQDLLREDMVDVLDLLLEGGLKQGRWIFAGDFSGQAIFSSGADEEQLLARLSRKGIAQAVFVLDANCRNALRVMESIQILAAPRIGYRSCLNAEFQGDFKPHFVAKNDAARQNGLKTIIASLKKRFQPEQIVVLSSRRSPDSTAARLALSEADLNLRELWGPAPGRGESGYATIHAFKGLDAPVIVLTDISSLEDAIFYTGISRGRQEVHVMLDDDMKDCYALRILR